jgi:hypothetical protein
MSLGGNMGPRYIMWLLFGKNLIANNSTTTEAREKNNWRFDLKTIKFYLIKFATYF